MSRGEQLKLFTGFEEPKSNTIYTPKQLFDVVLPHASLGAFRVVSYILFRTLGKCRRDGSPYLSEITISYQDLTDQAGVSKGDVKRAVQEALDNHWIVCAREPDTNCRNHDRRGSYALAWSSSKEYVTDVEKFDGFYSGEGYRVRIPNQFYKLVIPNEKHSVIKLVGLIFRYTIGWVVERGECRQDVPLSHRRIAELVNLNTWTVNAAVADAVERGYIRIVKRGKFTSVGSRDIENATVYTIRWSDECSPEFQTDPKELPKNPNRDADQNSQPEMPKKPNRRSPKSPASELPKIPNITDSPSGHADAFKQQQQTSDAVAELVALGVGKSKAEQLVVEIDLEAIRYQIKCYPYRLKQREWRNPTGMLIDSILNTWGSPPGFEEVLKKQQDQIKKEAQKARAEHEEQYTQAWQEYVLAEAERIKAEYPETFYIFLEEEEAGRDEISQRPIAKKVKSYLDRTLECYDRPAARCERLLEHFGGRILGFWDWDKELNPDRFQELDLAG